MLGQTMIKHTHMKSKLLAFFKPAAHIVIFLSTAHDSTVLLVGFKRFTQYTQNLLPAPVFTPPPMSQPVVPFYQQGG